MKRRHKMPSKGSKKYFSKTAGSAHVHPKNAVAFSTRGGIRL